MSTSAEPHAIRVDFDGPTMIVALDDGRAIRAAWARFPRLAAGTPSQRAHVRFVGRGLGIHWPELDEDLDVRGLLRDGVAVAAE